MEGTQESDEEDRLVEKSSGEPVENKSSIENLKERVIEAVRGGCDMRARFTVVSKPEHIEYLFFKTGDILTGVRQAVKPNWLRGICEGREGLVYKIDVEPLS